MGRAKKIPVQRKTINPDDDDDDDCGIIRHHHEELLGRRVWLSKNRNENQQESELLSQHSMIDSLLVQELLLDDDDDDNTNFYNSKLASVSKEKQTKRKPIWKDLVDSSDEEEEQDDDNDKKKTPKNNIKRRVRFEEEEEGEGEEEHDSMRQQPSTNEMTLLIRRKKKKQRTAATTTTTEHTSNISNHNAGKYQRKQNMDRVLSKERMGSMFLDDDDDDDDGSDKATPPRIHMSLQELEGTNHTQQTICISHCPSTSSSEYTQQDEEEKEEERTNSMWALPRIVIPRPIHYKRISKTICQDNISSTVNGLQFQTRHEIETLIRYCFFSDTATGGDNNNNNYNKNNDLQQQQNQKPQGEDLSPLLPIFQTSLIRSFEKGLVQVELKFPSSSPSMSACITTCSSRGKSLHSWPSGTCHIQIFVTPKTLHEVCHPSVWPLKSRNRFRRQTALSSMFKSIKQESMQDLDVIMQMTSPTIQEILVSSSLAATTTMTMMGTKSHYSLPVPTTSTTTMTATKVYKIVDNVQLLEKMQQRQEPQQQQVVQPSATAAAYSSNDRSGSSNSSSSVAADSLQQQIPGLVPTLRPYQKHAVEWMLQREKRPPQLSQNNSSTREEWKLAWFVYADSLLAEQQHQEPRQIHDWMSLKDYQNLQEKHQLGKHDGAEGQHKNKESKDGNLLYYCPFTGWFALSLQEAKLMTAPPYVDDECASNKSNCIGGGILAESMGLGKTVEVLACILANPWRPEGSTTTTTDNAAAASASVPSSTLASLSSKSNETNEEDQKTAATTATTNENRVVSVEGSISASQSSSSVTTEDSNTESSSSLLVSGKADVMIQGPNLSPTTGNATRGRNNEKGRARRKESKNRRRGEEKESSSSKHLYNDVSTGGDGPISVSEDLECEEGSIYGQSTSASNSTWVECEKCRKWRRMGVVDERKLPPKWYCWMNKNDPEHARCSAPEEEYDESNTPESAADREVNDGNSSSNSAAPVPCLFATNTATPASRIQTNTTSTVVVTPEKKKPPAPQNESTKTEEKWINGDIIGSCICSNLIGFSKLKKKKDNDPIIICRSCREPMHLTCAGFKNAATTVKGDGTFNALQNITTPIVYRKDLTNKRMECRICDPSHCPCCVASSSSPLSPSSTSCSETFSLLQSGATLIVTPPAILSQWEREVKRHTLLQSTGKPLNVVIYDGIKSLTNANSGRKKESIHLIHPMTLAKADIVLVTYDALMGDLGHSSDNRYISNGNHLRGQKRYRVIPSPLTSIHWYRICLDEAQRVETPTAGSARMALKLSATYRWCVSGTPIGKGRLEDLYGLLLFLRVEPFANKDWFQKCFGPTFGQIETRIRQLLCNIFWRSTKALETVREQMGIPEQVEKKVLLKFSSIEKHFYEQQLERTLNAVGDINDRQRSGKKRKASSLDSLNERLHRLRAACCHPQVGSSGLRRADKRHRGAIGTQVMSMEEILDRLIDDAKLKCEEALRVVLMHTNGMATLSKLKVEAKQRDVNIKEDDKDLLVKSCKLYQESIRMTEENAEPMLARGATGLGGSVGFRSSQEVFSNGTASLEWVWTGRPVAENIWTTVDFAGAGKKVTQIRVRSIRSIPDRITAETSGRVRWRAAYPKDCVFQVSSGVVEGEFVDVVSFILPFPDEKEDQSWLLEDGFVTNTSQSWRVVVKSYYPVQEEKDIETQGIFMGVELELYEPYIANDSIQRLHTLHNASLSFSSLLEFFSTKKAGIHLEAIGVNSNDDIRKKIASMENEARKIENLYMASTVAIHEICKQRLKDLREPRQRLQEELLSLNRAFDTKKTIKDVWDDGWYDDFLVMAILHGSESQHRAISEKLIQELEHVIGGVSGFSVARDLIPFAHFEGLAGFRTALQMRVRDIRTGIGRKKEWKPPERALIGNANMFEVGTTQYRCPSGGHSRCIERLLQLSSTPSSEEIYENSRCQVCKADFLQQGPKCRHCSFGEDLNELRVDQVTFTVLNTVFSIVRGPVGTSLIKKAGRSMDSVLDRAKKFFEILEAEKRETVAGWRMWRAHLDVMNALDEINQCKSAMRLSFEGEDLSELSGFQLNQVVMPIDVQLQYCKNEVDQARALGALQRYKETLRYLKNQVSGLCQNTESGDSSAASEEEHCVVCLSPFSAERAVLRCGHSFHVTPCLERLKSRCGGHSITCPMRCRERTAAKDVMIASERRRDNGSRSSRNVKGSWGTKVTRLVADVLDIQDVGDSGIIFSQWEDMLDIVSQALTVNNVTHVRPMTRRQIGESTAVFRSSDCTVMLLNIKNGAEGLTLLEATHIFMVEPVLNGGLDSQAINRIHRIGQNRKTYVHRYLVEDTIEIKIDERRAEHENDEVEDAINEGKKSSIKAGGIDGGFGSPEELMSMLSVQTTSTIDLINAS